MKSPTNRSIIKPAHQRLKEWLEGHCPYCQATDIYVSPGKGIKLECECLKCECKNTFSSPQVKDVVEEKEKVKETR